MSKTTPVRWWRSDEDRYRSRGTYVPPKPDPQWMIEMLAPLDPEMTKVIDWYTRELPLSPDARITKCATRHFGPSPLGDRPRAAPESWPLQPRWAQVAQGQSGEAWPMSGSQADLRTRISWAIAAGTERREVHRLRNLRRNRQHLAAKHPALAISCAKDRRLIRRWMRPWIRRMRQADRKRAYSLAQARTRTITG